MNTCIRPSIKMYENCVKNEKKCKILPVKHKPVFCRICKKISYGECDSHQGSVKTIQNGTLPVKSINNVYLYGYKNSMLKDTECKGGICAVKKNIIGGGCETGVCPLKKVEQKIPGQTCETGVCPLKKIEQNNVVKMSGQTCESGVCPVVKNGNMKNIIRTVESGKDKVVEPGLIKSKTMLNEELGNQNKMDVVKKSNMGSRLSTKNFGNIDNNIDKVIDEKKNNFNKSRKNFDENEYKKKEYVVEEKPGSTIFKYETVKEPMKNEEDKLKKKISIVKNEENSKYNVGKKDEPANKSFRYSDDVSDEEPMRKEKTEKKISNVGKRDKNESFRYIDDVSSEEEFSEEEPMRKEKLVKNFGKNRKYENEPYSDDVSSEEKEPIRDVKNELGKRNVRKGSESVNESYDFIEEKPMIRKKNTQREYVSEDDLNELQKKKIEKTFEEPTDVQKSAFKYESDGGLDSKKSFGKFIRGIGYEISK